MDIPQGLIYLLSGSLIPEYGEFPIRGITIGTIFKGPANAAERILMNLNIDYETRQFPADGGMEIFTDLLKQGRFPLLLYDNVVINGEAEPKDDFIYFRHYSSGLLIGYDVEHGKMLLSRRELSTGEFRQYDFDRYKKSIYVKLMPLAVNGKYYILDRLTQEKKNEINEMRFEYAKKSLLSSIDDYFNSVISDKQSFDETVALYGDDIFRRFKMEHGKYYGGVAAYEKFIGYLSALEKEIGGNTKIKTSDKLFLFKLGMTSVEMKISPTFYFLDLYKALLDFQSVSPGEISGRLQSSVDNTYDLACEARELVRSLRSYRKKLLSKISYLNKLEKLFSNLSAMNNDVFCELRKTFRSVDSVVR